MPLKITSSTGTPVRVRPILLSKEGARKLVNKLIKEEWWFTCETNFKSELESQRQVLIKTNCIVKQREVEAWAKSPVTFLPLEE
jgi:hypothetical protein